MGVYLTAKYEVSSRIWFCSAFFINLHNIFNVKTLSMINCYFLKLSFIWYFHSKLKCRVSSNNFRFFNVWLSNKNKWNIFFLLLINSLITIGLNFSFPIITAISSPKTTNTLHSFPGLFSLAFLYTSWMKLKCSIKVLRSLQCSKPTFPFWFFN